MPKLPRISGLETIRALERLGFQRVRQRGSHVVLPKGDIGCVVPAHDELMIGTLRSILQMAGVTIEDFNQALK
jgi:predicted RNA binding protein YcfA (HicA-like mRNA interferase family)